MEERFKEVYFNQYCCPCKFEHADEGIDPCNDCLSHPMNVDSHKPVNFTEK